MSQQLAREQTIRDALTLLATLYPAANYSNADLVIVAAVWAEDLAAYAPDVIAEAVKRHRRAARWFPTVADVVNQCELVASERMAHCPALPSATGMSHDEQCEFNARKVRDLLSMLERSMGIESPMVDQ